MTLNTRLEHIASEEEFQNLLENNENVMICCGRMGPMCIPVYKAMEDLKEDYSHIKFVDMLFDLPDARVIRDLPECRGFMGLPFTVYFKKGKVVKATTSIQSKDEVKSILENEFSLVTE
ncbi:MAG: thioredoxin family protein [Bacteroidales bacterium]|nr:thioredoxin family protein [Bacteroidales bacterium]